MILGLIPWKMSSCARGEVIFGAYPTAATPFFMLLLECPLPPRSGTSGVFLAAAGEGGEVTLACINRVQSFSPEHPSAPFLHLLPL